MKRKKYLPKTPSLCDPNKRNKKIIIRLISRETKKVAFTKKKRFKKKTNLPE